MEIAYCTRLIPHITNIYDKYPNTKFIVSVDKYIMNQVAGIEINTGKTVSIVNIPDVHSYPDFPALVMHKTLWTHGSNSKDIDIGFINLPFIRQIMAARKAKKCLSSWAQRNPEEKKVILTYSTNPMSMSPLVQLKKKDKNIKIVLVVGDLIGDKGINITRKGFINKLLNYYYKRGADYISEFDGYILLTEYMAEELRTENKPYIVIEGIYNQESEIGIIPKEKANNQLKIIFHAGSLERKYGVFNLIDAFSMIKDENYRLWLAGGSTESDVIERYCQEDHRIVYYGFLTPEKVYDLQRQATVIVNPRTTDGDYTKYSFPSKTMEGLASGKPFIGCKLPGIPNEYFDYIQCVEDNTASTLSKKIVETCGLPLSEQQRIGKQSREYIINNKNYKVQGKKIVELLESL